MSFHNRMSLEHFKIEFILRSKELFPLLPFAILPDPLLQT